MLDEIPELQETYSGARALAAFCPEPNSGDRSEELTLGLPTCYAFDQVRHS